MFPFEVRPLSAINNYSFSVPDVVGIDAIYLKALNLQENTPLIDSTGIPLFVKMGDSIIVLLDQFFQSPIDEGYVLTLNTRFDTLCQYDGTPFGRTTFDVQYVDECFRSPTTQRYHIKNGNTFVSGSPELEAFPENTAFSLTENLIDFKFFLRNNATTTAQFAWLVLDSGGQMTDIELTYDPSGTPVPQIGGIYQLGDLPAFDLKRFRLKAKNLSCKTIVLKLRFGWDCVQVLNPNSSSCGVFEQEIIIRPLEPELELVIRSQPTSIPMCQPSAFWEFEVSNANDGTAFDVTPSIKLPPGFKVVPGSAQLSYPAGAPFVNMQDPVQTPGNVWLFDPEATSAQLAQTGLITAEMSPLNTLRIRFRVIAECGAVSNSQPIFGAEAVRPCGAYSNVLRKPGEPVRIDGVSVGAPAVLNLQFSNPPAQASCGQQVQFSASIAISETPKAGDSIYVLLPAGTSFVAGSYQAGANAPAGPPKISGSQIQLPLPSNTAPGSVINFTFSIKYDDPAGCTDKAIVMQTREKTSAFCASTNQFCDIYVATGEVVVSLNAQNPDYQLSNLTLVTQGGQTSVSALLNNAGTTVGNNPVVEIYFDQNGNGQVDTGEPLAATLNYNGSVIPNSSVLISGNVNNLPPNAFCSLLALIPADENCACDDRLYPLPGNQLITQGIGLCSLQTVTVGVPTSQGSTYQWLTPQGLSCTACSEATYTPGPNVKPGDLVTLVLQETNGNCTIERRYEIQYGGTFGIETDDQTICEGSTAILQATLGGTFYNWSGPGITSPNQYNQVVQPSSTATYNVTVTFGGGCTGTGSVNIFVNKADQTILPALSTCEGQPISILGQVTDVPGIYTLKLQKKLTGCDSIISQELKVLATNTNASLPLCPGGVVTVFDEEVAAPANVCRTFTNSAGCDSTHCISVNLVPNPQLPGLDSAIIVALGESAVIPTPGNFVTYEWIPYIPNVISCSNCPNPVVTPDTSTTFLLIVTDANGCRDSATYRVFVCNEQEVIVPNAFTPNGDGFNDVFRIVPHEGAEVVLSLRIYDRWGQKLYVGSGSSAQWDGRIGDKPAPSDVYVWILEYECGGNRVRRSGDVTLLR
jgi:gliding motility-associated-like protein